MANHCSFELRARSRNRESVQFLLDSLELNISDELWEKYRKEGHFVRGEFNGTIKKHDDGNFVMDGRGDIKVCVDGGYLHGIEVLCEKYPDLEVEIISDEPGSQFSEYFYLENGKLVVEKVGKFVSVPLDEFTYNEFLENNPDHEVSNMIREKAKNIPLYVYFEMPEWLTHDEHGYLIYGFKKISLDNS